MSRRNLFATWMVLSAFWAVFQFSNGPDQGLDLLVLRAAFPPILVLLAVRGSGWIWKRLGEPNWSGLPSNVRRGLLRLYLAIALPWTAWFGFRILDQANRHSYNVWRYISGDVWLLVTIPLGAPILFMLGSWIAEGFRGSASDGRAEAHRKGKRSAEIRSGPERKSADDDLPPDVRAIFEKINFIWQDERAQIGGLPEPFRSKVSGGVACDKVEGAVGDFGRDVRNPIPVNGPLGELIYLSNLRTMKSQKIMFHRLGSLGDIDAYEVVSLEGAVWDILFLDLYHPRKSRRAPAGFRIASGAEQESLLFGANEFVAPFPDHLQDAIANTYERLIGVRIRTPQVREAVEREKFRRPADHQVRLNSVMTMLEAKADANPAPNPF